jgi:hypothetical protein
MTVHTGARFAQRHFALAALPRERWKNGGGWTCPVASVAGADGRPDWRISVAEITEAGPFSIFEGLDRQAVMLEGARLRLRAACPADDIVFDGPGSQAAFPGERALVADAPSQPTRLWNLMHRRGAVQAQLTVVADRVVELPAAPHVLVCVLGGEVELALPHCRSQGLVAGQGLHLQQLPARSLLAPCRPGSRVLVTALF